MDAILKRHSVRSYSKESIDGATIEKIVHAGMAAPSAMGSKPWHFIVISERDKMSAITKIHPYSQMLLEAQCAILVCGDISAEILTDYFQQNCAAATENILIAATSFGIGSVWVGLYPNEKYRRDFKKLFNLPDNIEPISLVPLGYPSHAMQPSNRFDSSRVHANNW
ncbi:MAG: nitroreductase family protein [Puniceicoccales bacterium]|jgi:nitroreductase|nr:nitroreductase family protein [Puniceicoccales bacterium]